MELQDRMKTEISKIKNIILEDYKTDGDYWLHMGNNLIYEILDTFDEQDWNYLKGDLINWRDFEHSIFSRAIRSYGTLKVIDKVDIYEIFFTEFVLQTDLDDADCQIEDIMYVQNIRNPTLELLQKIKQKIITLSNYTLTINSKENFKNAIRIVEDVISQRH